MSFFKGVFRSGNFSTRRLDAFSDGVFAIVITLLVLELRVPHAHGPEISEELARGLVELLPKFFSFILSFMYISIYWVNHHQFFEIIKKSDRGLFWFNSLFLMWLTFIPFPTAMIGEYPTEKIAVMLYGVAMFLTALSFVLMKWYAVHVGKLVDPHVEKSLFQESGLKIISGPILYVLALIFCFIDTRVAIFIYVIIPIIYFFPTKLESHEENI